MDAVVLAIFALVYAIMMLGGIPAVALDRAGAASRCIAIAEVAWLRR